MQTVEEATTYFTKTLGSIPRYGDVVLFHEGGCDVSGRYYGLCNLEDTGYHYIVAVVHMWGEPLNRLLHPAAIQLVCNDRFFETLKKLLQPVQLSAVQNWTNFSELQTEAKRTSANLAWATRLGIVACRKTEKMQRWELADLGYVFKKWLAETQAKAEAGQSV